MYLLYYVVKILLSVLMVFEILENDNSNEMYVILPTVQYISLIKKIDNYLKI